MTLGSDKFHIIDNASTLDKKFSQQLKKWGILAGFQHLTFRYEDNFSKGEVDRLCTEVLSSDSIRKVFKVRSSCDWTTVDAPDSVAASLVPCTETRLDMFDKLKKASDPRILQGHGWLVQKSADCVEAQGFLVYDNLREMILCEDSNNRRLLSEMDQQEFLYRLFCHLVLGGKLNQYEDDVDEYRQATKALYRALIRVRKESRSSDTLSVKSYVASVDGADFGSTPLFPTESINNFCYIVLDPISKIGHLCYHAVGM